MSICAFKTDYFDYNDNKCKLHTFLSHAGCPEYRQIRTIMDMGEMKNLTFFRTSFVNGPLSIFPVKFHKSLARNFQSFLSARHKHASAKRCYGFLHKLFETFLLLVHKINRFYF